MVARTTPARRAISAMLASGLVARASMAASRMRAMFRAAARTLGRRGVVSLRYGGGGMGSANVAWRERARPIPQWGIIRHGRRRHHGYPATGLLRRQGRAPHASPLHRRASARRRQHGG